MSNSVWRYESLKTTYRLEKCSATSVSKFIILAARMFKSALQRVSPRSLRRKFTTDRQPFLLATLHRSLLTASHSLHNKCTFLLLCHLGNLLQWTHVHFY